MKTPLTVVIESLAQLFEYPGAGYHALAEVCLAAGRDVGGDILPHDEAPITLFEEFNRRTRTLRPDELEELYTRTFDLNPTCALDLGWHLYGEQYQRGDFLVQLRTALRTHNIPEDTELPDHLPTVLRLLAAASPEECEELVRSSVRPALEKMLAAFPENENPFRLLLMSVNALMARQYPEQLSKTSPEHLEGHTHG